MARAAAKRDEQRRAREAMTTSFLASGPLDDVFDDELDASSNAVVDLIRAGKLEEAETAARGVARSLPRCA